MWPLKWKLSIRTFPLLPNGVHVFANFMINLNTESWQWRGLYFQHHTKVLAYSYSHFVRARLYQTFRTSSYCTQPKVFQILTLLRFEPILSIHLICSLLTGSPVRRACSHWRVCEQATLFEAFAPSPALFQGLYKLIESIPFKSLFWIDNIKPWLLPVLHVYRPPPFGRNMQIKISITKKCESVEVSHSRTNLWLALEPGNN